VVETSDPSPPAALVAVGAALRLPRLALLEILGFHLLPGVVFSGLLIVVSRVFVEHGLTGYLAELLLIPACLVPMLAGIMLASAKRAGMGFSLRRVIAYRAPSPVWDSIGWPVLLVMCWGLASVVVVPLSVRLEAWYLTWFPAQLGSQALVDGVVAAPVGQRHVTFVLAILLSGVLAPLIEEAYFRGFLLPRMEHLGWRAPVLSAFLFGLYHFFTPWSLPVIFVAFLPVAFVVQTTRNYRVGVIVHAVFNLLGVLTVFSSTP